MYLVGFMLMLDPRQPYALREHPATLQLNTLMYLPAEDLSRGKHAAFFDFNASITAPVDTKDSAKKLLPTCL